MARSISPAALRCRRHFAASEDRLAQPYKWFLSTGSSWLRFSECQGYRFRLRYFWTRLNAFRATPDRSRKCENRAASNYGRRLHSRD